MRHGSQWKDQIQQTRYKNQGKQCKKVFSCLDTSSLPYWATDKEAASLTFLTSSV